MKPVATLFEVTINFDWQDKNESSTWHCGSLEGARKFLREQKQNAARHGNRVMWYSIEGQAFLPCDENDPDGQLYISMTHIEFKEFHWNKERQL